MSKKKEYNDKLFFPETVNTWIEETFSPSLQDEGCDIRGWTGKVEVEVLAIIIQGEVWSAEVELWGLNSFWLREGYVVWEAIPNTLIDDIMEEDAYAKKFVLDDVHLWEKICFSVSQRVGVGVAMIVANDPL